MRAACAASAYGWDDDDVTSICFKIKMLLLLFYQKATSISFMRRRRSFFVEWLRAIQRICAIQMGASLCVCVCHFLSAFINSLAAERLPCWNKVLPHHIVLKSRTCFD